MLLASFFTIHNKSSPLTILIQQRKLLIFLRKTCMFLPVVFTCFFRPYKVFEKDVETKRRCNPAPFLDRMMKSSYFFGLTVGCES